MPLESFAPSSGSAPRRTRTIIVGMLLCAGIGTTSAPARAEEPEVSVAPILYQVGNATTGAAASAASTVSASADRSDGRDVRWLHEASGLTWEQLGRVFGVSRRAVHMWATGARMNSSNAETLFALAELVRSAPAVTPDDRRAWLLRSEGTQASRLDQFRESRRDSVLINRPALRAREALADQGDSAS